TKAVHENDKGRFLEVLEFGRFHLAINLRQRLLATHREDRVPKGNENSDDSDDAQPVEITRPQALSESGIGDKTERIYFVVRIVRVEVALRLKGGAERNRIPRQSG